jgi:hypothetical protein
MVLMPVSFYPMPSDDNSQAQVLQERKSELNNQAQTVEQSNLNGREKQTAVGEINDEISRTNHDITQKRTTSSVKQHMDNDEISR